MIPFFNVFVVFGLVVFLLCEDFRGDLRGTFFCFGTIFFFSLCQVGDQSVLLADEPALLFILKQGGIGDLSPQSPFGWNRRLVGDRLLLVGH